MLDHVYHPYDACVMLDTLPCRPKPHHGQFIFPWSHDASLHHHCCTSAYFMVTALTQAIEEQYFLCRIARHRPLAHIHLATKEAPVACPALPAAWTVHRQSNTILHGAPLLPSCSWCREPTGAWCDRPHAIGGTCWGDEMGALTLCHQCEHHHGHCRRCTSRLVIQQQKQQHR
jgi:hypothetical protein